MKIIHYKFNMEPYSEAFLKVSIFNKIKRTVFVVSLSIKIDHIENLKPEVQFIVFVLHPCHDIIMFAVTKPSSKFVFITNLMHICFILQYMYYIRCLDMFRAIVCSSSGGQNCIFTASGMSLSVSGRTVSPLSTDALYGHLQRVTYQML
jgi:hypothetical protein